MGSATGSPALRLRKGQKKRRWAFLLPGVALVFGTSLFFLFRQVSLGNILSAWTGSAPQVSATAGTVASFVALLALIFLQLRESRKFKIEEVARTDQKLAGLRENIHLFSEGECPQVRDVADLASIGVTRSLQDYSDGLTASYVPRDIDSELLNKVKESRFVLLVGESKSGKSRTAFEAVLAGHPDRSLLVPRTPGSLDKLISLDVDFTDCVIWLDDLERYLGADGVSIKTITALTSLRWSNCVVVATLRLQAKNEYAPRGNNEPLEWKVIQQAESVVLDRLLSKGEVERVRSILPRVSTSALEDRGIAEYLSAARDLVQRFDGARVGYPAGHAVVQSVVDLIRCGMRVAPLSDVVSVARDLLSGSDESVLTDEQWEAACVWAEESVYGTSSLVTRCEGGFEAFDYLVEELNKREVKICQPAWSCAKNVSGEAEQIKVAQAAWRAEEFETAMVLCRRLVNSGEQLVSGMAAFNASMIEAARGNEIESARWLTKSLEKEFVFAYSTAARRELKRKHWAKADKLARSAYRLGDQEIASFMGHRAMEREDNKRARRWLGIAADDGNLDCLRHLAAIEVRDGGSVSAREKIEAAAQKGGFFYRLAYAEILVREGDRRAARKLLPVRPVEEDPEHIDFCGFVAYVYFRLNDVRKSVQWYRFAEKHGKETAELDLAILMSRTRSGRAASMPLLEKMAASGSSAAKMALANVAIFTRKWQQAEKLLRELCDLNRPGAPHDLGRLYHNFGRFEEAMELFRLGYRQGHRHCAEHVAVMSIAKRDDDGVEEWLAKAAELRPSMRLVGELYWGPQNSFARRVAIASARSSSSLLVRWIHRFIWSEPVLGRLNNKFVERFDSGLSEVSLTSPDEWKRTQVT